MTRKRSMLLILLTVTLILTACFDTGIGPTVTYNNLFPIASEGNIWYYSDADSNQMIIAVKDTISDNGNVFVKVAITETKLQITDEHWLLKTYDEMQYSSSLSGDFLTLYKDEFHERGGSYYINGDHVDYSVYNGYTVNGKAYGNVVRLVYPEGILDGFSELYFADGIGPIQLVDDRGRWPVTYALDSAYVNGLQIQ